MVFRESQGTSSLGSAQDKEGTVPTVTPSPQQEPEDFSTGLGSPKDALEEKTSQLG